MMDAKFIIDEVSRMDWRPGWKLEAYMTEHQGLWFRASGMVDDAFVEGERVVLDIKSPIPPMRDSRQLADWVLWRLERIDVHECQEWFRVGGEQWFDPHAPGADEPAGLDAMTTKAKLTPLPQAEWRWTCTKCNVMGQARNEAESLDLWREHRARVHGVTDDSVVI